MSTQEQTRCELCMQFRTADDMMDFIQTLVETENLPRGCCVRPKDTLDDKGIRQYLLRKKQEK